MSRKILRYNNGLARIDGSGRKRPTSSHCFAEIGAPLTIVTSATGSAPLPGGIIRPKAEW
jgi:hypothetical protein